MDIFYSERLDIGPLMLNSMLAKKNEIKKFVKDQDSTILQKTTNVFFF